MPKPPILDELLALSRKRDGGEHFKRIEFDHGSIAFNARTDKKRISIEVDTWRSRNLLTGVREELQERHSKYLEDHPEVKRGGAVTAFGKPVSISTSLQKMQKHGSDWSTTSLPTKATLSRLSRYTRLQCKHWATYASPLIDRIGGSNTLIKPHSSKRARLTASKLLPHGLWCQATRTP